jgi:2-polyprenyl-3-methyl-5-hydroxy-6-metoxy-1,4-benzoquinol methylase
MSGTNPASAFYSQLEAEVLDSCHGLEPDDHATISRYYTSLKDNASLRPFYRYNWMQRLAPMQALISSLPPRGSPWRVLDAGCGVGTEAIFWATLRDDIEVIGTDIRESRLNAARARQATYESRLGKRLKLSFLQQDVFKVLRDERFDLVWTMEAISHIDPAEKFLADVSENLGDRGHLVVSDSHIWNPIMAWRVRKLRRQGVTLRTHKTISGGQTVSYAQERLLTVRWLSSMLKQVGFASVQTQLSVFFPPNLARSPGLLAACALFDRVMNRIPMIRNVGGIYTLVASK